MQAMGVRECDGDATDSSRCNADHPAVEGKELEDSAE